MLSAMSGVLLHRARAAFRRVRASHAIPRPRSQSRIPPGGRPRHPAPAPAAGGQARSGSAGRPRRLRPSPALRHATALACTAVLGGWLGLVVLGSVSAPVGPVETRMSLHPSLTGGSRVDIAPLGSLELASHRAPLRLDVDVRRINVQDAKQIINDPASLAGIQDRVVAGVESGVAELAVRSAVAAVAGALALGLVVWRRPRQALAAGGVSLSLFAACGAGALLTWNPRCVLEPRFTGLLSGAPQVVGNARSIVSDFDVYRLELAKLVTNVTRLYDTASTLPAYHPDPGTIRVLHVSDIHLNPAAWNIVRSVVRTYRVDVVIDTGDLTDHGSKAENAFTDAIPSLGAPYVYVRGNHDSVGTQTAVAHRKHAVVLDDGRTATVAGLRISGWGDPQFTPNRSVRVGGEPAEASMGRTFAALLHRSPVRADIAAVHEPTAAVQLDGTVPLVLAGHTHVRDVHMLHHGTRLFVQGSTGGAGLRALQSNPPTPVEMSVLYFDRDSHRLQAWDDITLGGLGRTTAQIDRHLADEPGEAGDRTLPSPRSGVGSNTSSPEPSADPPRGAPTGPGPKPSTSATPSP